MLQGFPTPSKYKVLVRCSTFNQAKYIEDTLKGFAMQQTNFPFLVYVIDDASTDGEQEALRQWIDNHCNQKDIKVYDNDLAVILMSKDKDNENCIYAIHLLKKNLYCKPEKQVIHKFWREQCEYEAPCEGDDYWTNSMKLQKQVDFLEGHPDYSMCFHGAKLKIENGGKTSARCEYVQTKEYTSNELKQEWIVPTASILYRLDILKKPIKNRDWLLYGDISLILQCAEHGRVMGFEDKMSVYRVNEGGVTQSRRPSLERAIKHDKCLYINFPKARKAVGLSLAGHYYSLGHNSKSFVDKIKNILLAFRYSPKYVLWKILSALLGKKTETAESGVVKWRETNK